MAQKTISLSQFTIASGSLSKATNTIMSSTTGIKLISIKFANGGSGTPHLASADGHTYRIYLSGTGSGSSSLQLYSIKMADQTVSFNTIGTVNGDSSKTYKGDIKCVSTISNSASVTAGITGTANISLNYWAVPSVEVKFPARSATTNHDSKPVIRMRGQGTSDGNTLSLQYKIDGGSWANIATGVARSTWSGGHIATALTSGAHTIYFRTYNSKYYSESINRTVTYTPISTLSAGDPITTTNMSNLGTYINNMFNYYNESNSSITTTTPSAGTLLEDTNWTNYASKINSIETISGKTAPTAETVVNASYYNDYITSLQNG